MGIVSILRRQRRAVLLGTLIVLLHAALFSVIGSSVALPRLPAGLPDMGFVQAALLPARRCPATYVVWLQAEYS